MTEKITPIQRDALLVERIRRYEPDSQIKAREFSLEAGARRDPITRKIFSDHDYIDDHDPPEHIVELLRQQLKPPYERFQLPVTSSQEYGFYVTNSKVKNNRTDPRLNFPKQNTEVTEIPDLHSKANRAGGDKTSK